MAFFSLSKYMDITISEDKSLIITGNEPPISIIIPAYNESKTIASSLYSLLQLYYPELELIVVNDGSKDDTIEVLINEFDLIPFPEAYRKMISTKEVRQVYISRRYTNLKVINKENGGKSDAINCGINISTSPLFCCVDADSILERYSLIRAIQPFMMDPSTIACGGTVRIANGCIVSSGHIVEKGLPENTLALLQLLEYLRSFLFSRIGWSSLNALMIISGAFGILRKDAVIKVGGYNPATVGEDMELIVRLHRMYSRSGEPYKITFIPDPVCWTEAPETLKIFGSQRIRWHRGLTESLWLNRDLLFSRKSGYTGWFAFPFFILFEWFSPFIEVSGYLFTLYLFIFGKISIPVASIFFLFSILLSVLLSTCALLLDEITFRGITRLRQIPVMFFASILECFGYRQINAFYRIRGAINFIFGVEKEWGVMTRSGNWQR